MSRSALGGKVYLSSWLQCGGQWAPLPSGLWQGRNTMGERNSGGKPLLSRHPGSGDSGRGQRQATAFKGIHSVAHFLQGKSRLLISIPSQGCPGLSVQWGGGAVNALVNVSILMITVALPKPASGLRLHHMRAFLLEGGECQAQTITLQEDERTKGTLAVLQNSFPETGEWLSW